MNSFTAEAKNSLKRWEALRLTSYEDDKLVWTIGYGHTGPEVVKGLVWTQDQAERALDRDISTFAIGVNSLLRGATLNDNQYSALLIFAYNIGVKGFATSSARTLVLAGQLDQVQEHMRLWNKITDPVTHLHVVDNGLIDRREKEIVLWNTPVQDPNIA